MKELEKNAELLQDLSIEEMENVNGGSWFSSAWNWVKEHVTFSFIPSGATF